MTLAPATRPKATRTEASPPVGRRRSPSSGAPAGVPLFLLQSTQGARETEARPERGGRARLEGAEAGPVGAPAVEGAPAAAPVESQVAAPAGGAAPVVEPQMPAPPERLGPEAQQRLEAAQQAAGETAAREAALPSAARTTQEARAAVTEPAEQRQAEEEAALVAALDQRPEPSPEIEALCQRIYAVIRAKRPPDEDSLLSADPEEAAREAGAQLDGVIEGDTARVGGQYDALSGGAEAGSGAPGEGLEAPPVESGGPAFDATGAAPDPVPAEDIDLGADVAGSAQRMEEAGMDTEPARLVESGPIAEAREAHGELAATAEREPAEVIAEQQAAIERAQADMAALQAQALEALRSARTGTITGSTDQQTTMVGSEEQMRRAAAERAESIFAGAQDQVRALLEPLPRTAMARWEAELPRLSREFREHLGRVQRWIDERHAGIVGAVVEIADSVLGYPAWVVDEYDAAEQRFGDGVCDVIRDISRDINAVIAAAEALIADARRRIDEVFAALPTELQGWAAEQRQGFSARLDALQAEAHQARDDFNHQLAERASGAVQEVRQEIHQLRVEAGGLLGRIEAAIEAFLDDPVRFIVEGLLALVGIPPASFWAAVDRLGEVIAGIADDPLGFAGNLLDALAQGFTQFFDNIATHLLQGLLDWLFSKMSGVGVQLPTDLSLGSVITFFLQLMGLTWDNIREILARHIGEENVALLEQAFEIIAVLVEQGPRGIFEMIKDQLDPAVIFDAVMDAAIDMVVEALITQATIRILAMLNPVGAILQAIEAIYRVLRWVFENAARIFSLVETIVNGAWDIMNGNIGGMASAVERSLAGLLPPVIDFLASYVGLGDLPERIAEVIRGLQEWVLGLVDRVVGFIVGQARRLLAALGIGAADEDEDLSDHATLARRVKQELEEVPGTSEAGYDELRTIKEQQADELIGRYSGFLAEGIGLSIEFTSKSDDERDQDLDFEVIIAPNTTTLSGSVAIADPNYPHQSAPGLGDIAKHGERESGSSRRDGPQIWQLESEHILPFATGRELWLALSLSRPGRGLREDKGQTTIMIYERAARIKTPEDNRVSREIARAFAQQEYSERFQRFVARHERGDRAVMMEGRQLLADILEILRGLGEDAAERTWAAVQQENQETEEGFMLKNAERRAPPPNEEPPTPDWTEIDQAVSEQCDDILELVTEAIWERRSVEARVERIQRGTPRN